ncbi:MAG: hypothetical protein FMNOHCHN_03498 [Ignavibacteriaceae bacterium]|nr:hypothetical protein [Ignavibacteriaceae bacterium]
MLNLNKTLRKISSELSELEEFHEIDGRIVRSEFICNFGPINRCSRHKVYINNKAVGWYEEGPSKSFLESNWSVWILDSIYFKNKDKDESGKPFDFETCEMPYSDPPLFCPVFDNPVDFLKCAVKFGLV